MGRFSSSIPSNTPSSSQNQIPVYNSNCYGASSMPGMSQQDMRRTMELQEMQRNWPTVFPKPVIGLDRDGTINQEIDGYITHHSQIEYIPGSLEAIRMIRLKGHRLMILTNQAGISKKLQTQEQVDSVHNGMMQDFGNAGIFSIDGLLYSTSNFKEDIYAKPNIGMFNRAKEENKVNWKEGWYVGDSITDLHAADRAGSKPILVLTGKGIETLEKLESFSNRDLKKKTKVYNNLLEFAQSL